MKLITSEVPNNKQQKTINIQITITIENVDIIIDEVLRYHPLEGMKID